MTKTFLSIWSVAVVLALGIILSLATLGLSEPTQIDTTGFPKVADTDVVFIGSSLTGYALGSDRESRDVLGSRRSHAVLFAPDISEQLSTSLVFHAIESGAKVVAVEINAYAFSHTDSWEPAFLDATALRIRRFAERIALGVRILINELPKESSAVYLGPRLGVGSFDGRDLHRSDINRLVHSTPSDSDSLRAMRRAAEASGARLFLLLPPRSISVARIMGADAYEAHILHASRLASTAGLPLWRAEHSWPDNHFADAFGHVNELGRKRFTAAMAAFIGPSR